MFWVKKKDSIVLFLGMMVWTNEPVPLIVCMNRGSLGKRITNFRRSVLGKRQWQNLICIFGNDPLGSNMGDRVEKSKPGAQEEGQLEG